MHLQIVKSFLIFLIFILFDNVDGTSKKFDNTFPKHESLYGIGARIEGDELLIKDLLKSPTSTAKPRNHTIPFQYPINNKIVTYIELGSDSNVRLEFTLGVVDEDKGGILIGVVTAIEAQNFNFKISIFGFNKNEVANDVASILHSEVSLHGQMEPRPVEEFEPEDNYYDFDNDEDNIMLIGERQPGDYLLYETTQSSTMTDIRTNHSVTFYYIDSVYITCAKFTATTTHTASATFSHMTDHSLKATIHDSKVFELNVVLQVFGYEPKDKPDDYYPPLPAAAIDESLVNVKSQSLSEPVPENIMGIECMCSGQSNIKFYLFSILFGLILIAFV